MSGPWFSVAAVLGLGLAAIAGVALGFAWIIPIALIGAVLLMLGPIQAAFKGRKVAGVQPHVVPSTSQASYDPADPDVRS